MMLITLLLAPVVAADLSFTCTPTRVWDGDGPIWCAEGPKIRLAGIAAREMDETCRPGHPCPDGSGKAARDHLVSLLGGPRGVAPTGHVLVKAAPLSCRSDGNAKGDRTAARCVTSEGTDLGCAMVRSGHALIWRQYAAARPC